MKFQVWYVTGLQFQKWEFYTSGKPRSQSDSLPIMKYSCLVKEALKGTNAISSASRKALC